MTTDIELVESCNTGRAPGFPPRCQRPKVVVIGIMEFMRLLFSSNTRPPFVKQRHRNHATTLVERLPPNAAIQLILPRVVDRRVEAPVKSPAHQFHPAVHPHHDVGIKLSGFFLAKTTLPSHRLGTARPEP